MKLLLMTILAVALVAPTVAHAREEKPISMEAIMEELASLRTLVETQQKQIEQLQAAAPTAAATAPRAVEPAASAPAAQAVATDIEKKIDTVTANLNGFKFSGDFR